MDFSLALALLRQGHSIRRDGWRGKDRNLHLQEPDALSKMTLPYIYLEYPAGPDSRGRVPWVASQTDLLAHDWVIAERTPAKAPQTAQERVKPARKGKGSTNSRAPLVRDPEAPYGRKLDGTPRATPGRKPVATADISTPAAQ